MKIVSLGTDSQSEFKSNFISFSYYTEIFFSDESNWFFISVMFLFPSLRCCCQLPFSTLHVLFPCLFPYWGFTGSELTLL